MKRTLRALVNEQGKVYIRCNQINDLLDFAQQATKEGFHIGNRLPTEVKMENIMAVDFDGNISFPNDVGLMAYQCNSSPRIDYAKYINGDSEYVI